MSTGSTVGTVTFLFTDIEGSTRLWERDRERMAAALARHDALSRAIVAAHRGVIVKTTGDGMLAAFDDPSDALVAIVELQRALCASADADGLALSLRSAVHAGVVEKRDGDYFGTPLNHAARIMGQAHGGQILVSRAVASLVQERLPPGIALRELGWVRLRDVAKPEEVYQLVHAELRQDFPSLRALRSIPNNLPQQVTSFVGRERQRVEVRRLLKHNRLVTLVGVGGLGKTRLSLQVVTAVLDNYPDGVWLVELAAVADERQVGRTVAASLRVKEDAGRPVLEALRQHVADRRLLLVLDNCEHVARACADLATPLLQAGPELTLLVTSREPLRVAGETVYELPTLSVPGAEEAATPAAIAACEAVRLFVDRAVGVQPAFRLTRQNARAVAEICTRLDGIPLAIELAAARVRALAVVLIAERLRHRFQLLTGGDRTALPRQQTLRACMDWSYELLSPPERSLLQRLAVFAGSFTLEAVEAVCAGGDVGALDVLDLVAELVDKSLVRLDSERSRYRLLETVRDYACERLAASGEEAAWRARHAAHFLALADEAEPFTRGGPQQKAWLDRLDVEHDNLRAALSGALAQADHGVLACRLAAALWRFWCYRGHWREGRGWCLKALERADGAAPALRARVLMGAGTIGGYLGLSDARGFLDDALAVARTSGDRDVEAATLNTLAKYLVDRGDPEPARPLLEQALAINRERRNDVWITMNLHNLATVFRLRGDHGTVTATAEEALAHGRRCGNQWLEASTLGLLGELARERNDLAAAEPLHEQARKLLRELGFVSEEAYTLVWLADVAVDRGETELARSHLVRAHTILRKLGAAHRVPWSLLVTVGLAVRTGACAAAARFWGAAQVLSQRFVGEPGYFDAERFEVFGARCRDALGSEAFAAAAEGGRALSAEEAIDEVLAWLGAGGDAANRREEAGASSLQSESPPKRS